MKTIKIYLNDDPYYLSKMKDPDTTHFKMSINDFNDEDSVSAFHVGQISGYPYYNDVRDWLRLDDYDIDGRCYYTL